MNEGRYQNRKLREEGSRKESSRFSQFREAGLAVNTNVVIGLQDPSATLQYGRYSVLRFFLSKHLYPFKYKISYFRESW